MARLADEIINAVRPAPWINSANDRTRSILTRNHEYVRDALINDPVIDITNVADYTWATKENWSTLDPDEFPCLAPPYPRFFMEYRRPAIFVHQRDDLRTEESKRLLRNGEYRPLGRNWVETRTDGWPIERYGFLFDAIDLRLQQDFPSGTSMIEAGSTKSILDHIHPDSRWLLRGAVYVKERAGGKPIGPLCYWFGGLDERGILLQDAKTAMPALDGAISATDRFEWSSLLVPTFMAPLRAISYMHCRNINTQTVTPEAGLSKKWRKRTGRPLIRYRTLVIDPVAGPGGTRGPNGTTGPRSHHFVRGHYRDAREKGLFGRAEMKGIFWIPLHTAGSKEVGETIGDVLVKPPR